VLGLGQPGRGPGSPGRHSASRSTPSRATASKSRAPKSTAPSSAVPDSATPESGSSRSASSRSAFSRSAAPTSTAGLVGSAGSQGFGVLADAWRELERSLAAVAVAKGSREHCAQLAELTFGWSGRLTATLRAPLTDHVDGCPRCQHYLHTVIGTPAAPTILPFVAAPRALREILLDELHDPSIALRLGIDHGVIAARIQRFAPNGFPAIADSVPVRRRGGRRAATRVGAGSDALRQRPGTPPTNERQQDELPRRTPGASGRRAAEPRGSQSIEKRASQASEKPRPTRSDTGDSDTRVYCAPGSWAARVLPAEAADAGSSAGSGTTAANPGTLWRPPASSGGGRDAGGAHYPSDARGGREPGDLRSRDPHPQSHPHPRDSSDPRGPRFVSTPSGRFAVRAPETAAARPGTGSVTPPLVVAPSSHRANERARTSNERERASLPTSPSASPLFSRATPTPTSPLPRFAAPAPERPRGADGQPRARHKSRPVRQAVLSAVALGAVGAAAAASAALIGLASDSPPSQSLDALLPQEPLGTAGGSGGLTVSVSTPPPAGSSPASQASNSSAPAGRGPGAGGGLSGAVTGGGSPASGPSSPSSGGQGVNPADFHVSVNQRDADPSHVMILLRNTGSVPIVWHAATRDTWVRLSQGSGTLAAGRSTVVVATVTSAAPPHPWTSTITFAPGGAVVTLRGGSSPTGGGPSGGGSPSGSSTPTRPPSTAPSSPGQPSSSGPAPSSTPSADSSSSRGGSPSAVRSSPSQGASSGGGVSPSA